jgi:hypothetical protein
MRWSLDLTDQSLLISGGYEMQDDSSREACRNGDYPI